MSVLDLFDVEHPDWAVDEAAETLNLATSTAYRYFASLTTAGMLAPAPVGRYVLGPTIIRYDRSLRLTDPLIAASSGELRALAAMEPGRVVALLCRLFGDHVMCVDQAYCGSDPSFSAKYERGRPMPLLQGSASKVILANLPTRRLKALYAKEAATFEARRLGATWNEVRLKLRHIRTTGLLTSTSELDSGMRAASVPLVLGGGTLLASLNVVGPKGDLTEEMIDRMAAALRQAGARITSAVANHATPPSSGPIDGNP